jgi:hypothetical protein
MEQKDRRNSSICRTNRPRMTAIVKWHEKDAERRVGRQREIVGTFQSRNRALEERTLFSDQILMQECRPMH